MICPRCEMERDGAPWCIANRTTGKIELYCSDCALIVMEQMIKERQAKLKKISEN